MHKRSSNRSFGLVFFFVFLVIAFWPTLNSGFPNFYLILLSLVFLFLGLINSKFLTPLNNLWIKFGELLGMIIAPVVMGLVYFIILTPISFLIRILGKDLLNLKYSNKNETYWIKRKKNTGTMDKQF